MSAYKTVLHNIFNQYCARKHKIMKEAGDYYQLYLLYQCKVDSQGPEEMFD